jgi:electron transport complex protein RnfB
MHTVVLELCTGCKLCVAPCPVDCIAMVPRASIVGAPLAPAPEDNRARYEAHGARTRKRSEQRASMVAARKHLGAEA